MDALNPSVLAPDPLHPKGAHIAGESEEYRYLLWRTWDPDLPRLLWVLLNPSKADAENDDNTVACCARFSRDWDYGGLEIVNLFAFRSTNPKNLRTCPDPIGPENDRYIAAAASRAACIVVAWGTWDEKGILRQRDRAILALLQQHAAQPLLCLGIVGNGSPHHALRLSASTRPVPFQDRRRIV